MPRPSCQLIGKNKAKLYAIALLTSRLCTTFPPVWWLTWTKLGFVFVPLPLIHEPRSAAKKCGLLVTMLKTKLRFALPRWRPGLCCPYNASSRDLRIGLFFSKFGACAFAHLVVPTRCLPSCVARNQPYAKEFHFDKSHNHWACLDTQSNWFEHVLDPYFKNECAKLNRPYGTQKCVLLLDCWPVHRCEEHMKVTNDA